MLWVALYCPTLPLDRIQRRLPEALALPMAVCASHGAKRWIDMVNDAAKIHGITAGQPVATALAICPQILLHEHDAQEEQAALHEAALACLRYTPSVHVRTQGLLLEIAASVRLFKGRQALCIAIRKTLQQLGLRVLMGVAPTAHGAWLLARSARFDQPVVARSSTLLAQLDGLPVVFLETAAEHLQTLHGIGCRTLGQLMALPRSGLARRFGAGLLHEVDRAYGTLQEAFEWFQAPARFEARLELIARVESAEALVFAARRLLMQLAGWLAARQTAAGRLTLSLHHERWRPTDQRTTLVEIRLSQPSRDPEHLHGLIRERLSQMVLASPVEELGLSADDLALAEVPNQELFPTPASSAVSFHQLIEKLTARLGPQAVTRVSVRSDHRPEKAWASASASLKSAQEGSASASARPTWLLPAPVPLRLEAHRPIYGSALMTLCGPERIETGWWDDELMERDYFIAENDAGQLLWVFRQRHPHQSAALWYLHGLFA